MRTLIEFIKNLFWAIFHPKKLNQAIREYHSLDQLPVSYFIANMKGVIKYANKSALKEFGYESAGMSIFDVVSHEEVDDVKKAFEKIKNGHNAQTGERRMLMRSNKTVFPGILYLSTSKDGIRGVIINHSGQEKIENELKKLNEDKDNLFSIIAHDLRSPITSVVSSISFIADNLRSSTDQTIKKLAEIARNEIGNTLILLDGLLEWGRIKIQKKHSPKVAFIITDEAKEALALIKQRQQLKDITIETSLPELKTLASPEEFKIVLRNLLTNAIKFTPEGGKIYLKATDNEEIQISVSDTGVGMDATTLHQLFNSGQVFSNKGTNNERGNGLGLILCKELIEKWGGKITVTSALGKGSTFSFTLPRIN